MRKAIHLTVVVFILGTFFGISVNPARAAGITFYVSTSGNDLNDCLTPVTACLTIQAAINKAGTDDIVSVASGSYNESPRINKSLVLQGAGRDVI
jgi:hypothetical protein